MHSSTNGDHISTVIGTYYHTVVGEHGVNVQKGNSDTKINDGEYKVFSKGNFLLESETRIQLKVGASLITIEPSKITIKSAAIEFIQ